MDPLTAMMLLQTGSGVLRGALKGGGDKGRMVDLGGGYQAWFPTSKGQQLGGMFMGALGGGMEGAIPGLSQMYQQQQNQLGAEQAFGRQKELAELQHGWRQDDIADQSLESAARQQAGFKHTEEMERQRSSAQRERDQATKEAWAAKSSDKAEAEIAKTYADMEERLREQADKRRTKEEDLDTKLGIAAFNAVAGPKKSASPYEKGLATGTEQYASDLALFANTYGMDANDPATKIAYQKWLEDPNPKKKESLLDVNEDVLRSLR